MNASKDAAADYAAMREDLTTLKNDVMRLATSLSNSAGEKTQSIGENLDQSARQLYGSASAQGNKAAQVVSDKMDEQPMTALLIAAAIGFVGAKLLSR